MASSSGTARPTYAVVPASDAPAIANRNPAREYWRKVIDNPGESRVSIVFFMLLTCTILVSVINRNLATTLKVRNDPDAKAVVDGIEIACTVFFSFELCARIFA